jgi:hypothetical protein
MSIDVARLLEAGLPALLAQVISGGDSNNFRNLLDGGDFTVNPFQRNIAGLATANALTTAITSATPGYFADRWFGCGGGTTSIAFSSVADTTVPGFNTSLVFGRTSTNTTVVPIYLGQVLELGDSVRCQGQPVVFSFWVRQGANYSGGNLTVQVIAGTGTNDTAAHMNTVAWTNQTNIVNQSVPVPTTMTRLQFGGVVPATLATPAVALTQLGVQLSYTPAGTAGAADNIIVNGFQLEIGTTASLFEHRDPEVELGICQRYCAVFAEPASGVIISGAGMMSATNAQQVTIPLPTTMVKAPAVTVSAGTLKFNIAGTPTAVGGGFAGGTTHTPTMITVVGTVTATAGQATNLQGTSVAGAGYVLASADF